MADTAASTQIPEKECEANLEALVTYCSGGPKTAVARTETEGISKSIYHYRKEQFLDEMEKIHASRLQCPTLSRICQLLEQSSARMASSQNH